MTEKLWVFAALVLYVVIHFVPDSAMDKDKWVGLFILSMITSRLIPAMLSGLNKLAWFIFQKLIGQVTV
jgi:hypothetical protein